MIKFEKNLKYLFFILTTISIITLSSIFIILFVASNNILEFLIGISPICIILVLKILIFNLIFNDSNKNNINPWFSVILVIFIPNILGVIIYLLFKNKLKYCYISIKFKIHLIIAICISLISLLTLESITLEFFNLMPKAIEKYLTGFSFVISPLILVLSILNFIPILFKSDLNKNKFNFNLFLILNSTGLIPFTFFVFLINHLGF